ncbi:MAG: hypothetical protein U0637_08890 [Phycisphaerales bacterium]
MRSILEKYPWLGWALAGLLLGLSIWLYFARTRGATEYDPDSMKEMLTIRYTDTNETEKIPRGRLDQMLRRSGDQIDPSKGITNPKTGQPTGFLVDEDEWSKMIDHINRDKSEAKAASGGKARVVPQPAPRQTPAPPTPTGK